VDDDLNLPAYLQRIGVSGALRPDLPTLAALQAAHVASIPFEGLDPFLRRPVTLDLATLQDKIFNARRGGYCFELNTLFKAGLEAIGFSVTALAARVRWMSAPGDPLGPRSHMLLKVETSDGPRLADVGFGACMLDAPLPLIVDEEIATPLGVYKLAEANGLYALSARRGEGWRTMYVFDLQPQLPSDFVMSNWFTSTHSDPPFQHFVMVERIVGARRHKIVNRRYLVEGRDGVVESERVFADAEDMGRILDEVFAIAPPVAAAELFARAPA
jgi:N-hydroxyarylamine O-acetyltransferase